ncbi:RagB/SusD family nutrient uptake outer membrane protein [Flagellimonas okinawensis]|uniref:RagB/SusD family nutrient uptake outer membrane protein n=1 Tax=Flagellimonas okinawensis TaxID=3031324 RepID=A0ABT5XT27_9FLAO|nr:RagB/SusD family nutrient uptake outer membrane protein [[Muricauda] okinawensis]MDF0709056.1 RagB/SusD family nutrient uptake outer membrane protein [[Muricauda] okinawensis]
MKRIKKFENIRWEFLGYRLVVMVFILALANCTDFVEVDPPKNIMVSQTVFEDASTVESAMADLYFSMRESGMVSGNYGFTTRMGIYSDELDYYGFDVQLVELYQNQVLPANTEVQTWWSEAYTVIYGANAIIEGVESSSVLEEADRNRFKGQALFVRGLMHYDLVSVFGDVPYVTTTDYRVNSAVSRLPEVQVLERIESDLLMAVELMGNSDIDNMERTVPDHFVAKALLARLYGYMGKWDKAEDMATDLMSVFDLEEELGNVFLKGSGETIWQLSHGELPGNTQEAVQLIIPLIPGQSFAMTDGLLAAFEDGDLRRTEWVDSISDAENTLTLYYPYKYKARFNATESLEYSIQFRLAEQFLIRSEARAHQGNLVGALADLNEVRNRAGLVDVVVHTEGELLEAILGERRIELFTEQGHRWFDLKRTGRAAVALGALKPSWEDTDLLLPVPEGELQANPNLLPQNQGY